MFYASDSKRRCILLSLVFLFLKRYVTRENPLVWLSFNQVFLLYNARGDNPRVICCFILSNNWSVQLDHSRMTAGFHFCYSYHQTLVVPSITNQSQSVQSVAHSCDSCDSWLPLLPQAVKSISVNPCNPWLIRVIRAIRGFHLPQAKKSLSVNPCNPWPIRAIRVIRGRPLPKAAKKKLSLIGKLSQSCKV